MTVPQNIVDGVRGGPLTKLFSVVLVLDRELNMVLASDTLQTFMPELKSTQPLLDWFSVLRPGSVATVDDIERNLESLFLLIATDQSFAIRGQFIKLSDDAGEGLVFCGAPWLFWMNSNCPETKLGLKDFSPQDVQIDQLFYMATETRMVEDLERLNAELKDAKGAVDDAQAARNAFFAQMSHEMRTPLNGVVSALALMREQQLGGKAAELLELASKSSDNLLQVVNYVLDVSKLESASATSEVIRFDLRELVASVVDIVRARSLEKNLVLHSHVDAGLAGSYLGDTAGLRQVLLNLLVNAVKFTDRGAVSLTVHASDSEEHTLRIEIADTGLGIPEDELESIFDAYTTLATSKSSDPGTGTGLGLDIARRTITAMGGDIGVASSPGVGSTFRIELPLEAAEIPVQASAQVPVSAEQTATFSGCVLLVDDNQTNLMLGEMILESMGVAVIKANDGEMAVQLAQEEAVDLVLMDISMPGMDGYEATRLIRLEKSPEALPIVALTAYASSVEREKSRECGMNDYLTKPIEKSQLIAALSVWLAPRQDAGEGVADAADARVERAVITSMREQIGSDNLITVIDKFSDEAGKRWQALENAASSSDLAREAHTLASICQSFGLPGISDRLRAIEKQAKAGATVGELAGLRNVADSMKRGLHDLQAVIAGLQD